MMSSERSEEVKVDTVRSYSGGLPGRALNQARTNHFVIDSPSGPHEALSSGEAFLAGVSSCGVTLIELYAAAAGRAPPANRGHHRRRARGGRAQSLRRGAHALRAPRGRPGAGGVPGRGLPGPLTPLPHGRGRDHGEGQRAGEARMSHHHAAGGTAAEPEPFTRALERMNRFQEPEAHTLVADLELPAGSRGLDVGCGVGLYTLWLAQAVGPGGRVLGIEPGEERVEAARALAGDCVAGPAARISRGRRHRDRRARRHVRLALVRGRAAPHPGHRSRAQGVHARAPPGRPRDREGVAGAVRTLPARASGPRAAHPGGGERSAAGTRPASAASRSGASGRWSPSARRASPIARCAPTCSPGARRCRPPRATTSRRWCSDATGASGSARS